MSDRDDPDDSVPVEIPLVGELAQREADILDKLLSVPAGGQCILYFNSPGGSAYAALAIMSLVQLRGLRATGIVIGECSSAAIWPFAVCSRRLVTPHSIFLFHAMRWESGEHIELAEATEWARQFGRLEQEMDEVLAGLFGLSKSKLQEWLRPGRYVTGRELAESGLAEMIPLAPLAMVIDQASPRPEKRKKKVVRPVRLQPGISTTFSGEAAPAAGFSPPDGSSHRCERRRRFRFPWGRQATGTPARSFFPDPRLAQVAAKSRAARLGTFWPQAVRCRAPIATNQRGDALHGHRCICGIGHDDGATGPANSDGPRPRRTPAASGTKEAAPRPGGAIFGHHLPAGRRSGMAGKTLVGAT